METGASSSTAERMVLVSLTLVVIIATGSFAYLRFTEPPEIAIRRSEHRTLVQKDLKRLKTAVESHRAKHGSYPRALEDLAPEFMEAIPIDPWGRLYLFYQAGDAWRLASYGKDGQPGKHPWYDLETLDAYVFLEPEGRR
ncbi:MAG: type II secretion system protein GspG [Nitrospinota bacterium]|nr:type II secretion system protein GspG [Nitrospinota bacterium]